MTSKAPHGYSARQIIDWTDGQGWIVLIRGGDIVAKFSDWNAARAAYRDAVKAFKGAAVHS